MLAACRLLAPGGRGGPRGAARAGLVALTGVRARIKSDAVGFLIKSSYLLSDANEFPVVRRIERKVGRYVGWKTNTRIIRRVREVRGNTSNPEPRSVLT